MSDQAIETRVLVIGGSGFVGPNLVRELHAAGYQVTLLNRGTRQVPDTAHLKANRNSPAEMEALNLSRAAFTAVIDLSCYTLPQARLAWQIFSGRTLHWLHLSSAAVYKHSDAAAPTENAAIGGAPVWGQYGCDKSEIDCFLLQQQGGPKVTILRPPYLYGPGNNNDRETFVWSRALRGRPVLVPSGGQTPIQFLHVSDLAKAFVAALARADSAPAAYNVAADEEISLADFVAGLATICDSRNPTLLVGDLDRGFRARDYFPFRDTPCRVNTAFAHEQLDWRAQYTFASGFKNTFGTYSSNELALRPLDTGIEDHILRRMADRRSQADRIRASGGAPNKLFAACLDAADEIVAQSAQLAVDRRERYVERLSVRGKPQEELAREAREARDQNVGTSLIVRASYEISNHCRQKCSFCGMNALNRQLPRYRFSFDDMEQVIGDLNDMGITDLHLASGEDWAMHAETLERVIKRAVAANLEVTLVTGHRPLEDYRRWWEAGAGRYILKVETTNPVLFKAARLGTELRTRVAHLLFLRAIGFKIGTGIICGLPGQTVEDLAGDLCFLRRMEPDMASVSRFLPNQQSVFAAAPEGDPDLTLNFISLIRLEVRVPDLRIPAGTTLGRRQVDAINHGANVVSLHVTPTEVAELYSADKVRTRHLTQMDMIMRLAEESGTTVQATS